jgi:TP901 family phage tail tape measure protein
MSKSIALGVVLGATMSSGFGGVLGAAKTTLTSLGATVKGLEREFKGLKREQDLFNKGSMMGPVRQIANFDKLSDALKKAKTNSESLNKSLKAHQESKIFRQNTLSDMRGTALTGAAIAAPLGMSIKAFMEQENAAVSMKMAFMKAGGGVSDAFEGIKNKAVELGNTLPGTTGDFMTLGRVLKEQGLADNVIKNGALESAAKLNVLLGTSQEFGGEFIAKMMEARGIQDAELGAAADLVQKARYAFGMKPQDMMESMKYDAPIANVLNIKGLDKTKDMLALQGMGATTGLEGAQWGTNMRALMMRMGEGVEGVKNATKGNKAVARGQMEQAGVDFQFYDKNGKFKGPEAMVVEMEKLKVIKDKLGEKAALNVATEVFGMDAAGAALIIAEKGKKGLDENRQKMDEQASMQERMAEQSKSLNSIWENLTGTAINLAASLGGVFGDDIKSGMKTANDFVGNTLMPWVTENKGLIKTVVSVGAGLLGMKLAIGAGKLAFSSIMEPIRLFKTALDFSKGVKSLYDLNRLAGGGKLVSFFRSFKSTSALMNFGQRALSVGKRIKDFAGTKAGKIAGKGLGAAAGAYGLYSIARDDLNAGAKKQTTGQKLGSYAKGAASGAAIGMMFGPIGAVAGAALGLVYTAVVRNWDKVKSYTSKAWKSITTFAKSGIGNISKTILNWSPIGLFYKAFAKVLNWFGVKLPADFTGFGSMIIDGLGRGIEAMFPGILAKLSAFAESVKTGFKSIMGIHSPSRVFKGFGGYLMEGLSLGIDSKSRGVLRSVASVGSAIQKNFAPKLALPKIDAAAVFDGTSAPPKPSAAGAVAQVAGGIVINIYQQAGQDAKGLAQEVMRLIEQKTSLRKRATIGDLA